MTQHNQQESKAPAPPAPPTHSCNSIARDLADEFKALHGAEVRELVDFDADNGMFAILPKDKRIESLKPILDQFLDVPTRRRGTSTLKDLASFLALIQRFDTDNTAIFADTVRTGPSVTAIFDYHPAGSVIHRAERLAHRAIYKPELSNEWRAWTAANKTLMPQAQFAEFIEEHVTDLIVPNLDDPKLKTFADLVEGKWATPSQLVALSRSLQVNVESIVKNAQTLQSGELAIVYEEVHKDGAGAPLRVPSLFTIAIPVFYAGEAYRIAARLRYRVSNGRISWMYDLVRPDLVFDDAVNTILDEVRTSTSRDVFIGTPESPEV